MKNKFVNHGNYRRIGERKHLYLRKPPHLQGYDSNSSGSNSRASIPREDVWKKNNFAAENAHWAQNIRKETD